ncbi:MAG: Gfo/Idh/MocA family oxidoreductase [Bryobacteraceae bacterium]|jgi:predicted dehydrogenase
MRVGIIGTGAISHMHARAYRNIGYRVTACNDISREAGEKFAAQWGCEFVPSYEDLCSRADVDFVDVCTFPDFRLQAVEAAARHHKDIQLQKPIATNLETARKIVATAREANIVLGVASQHRFDDSTRFVKKAIAGGRLGRILQADAYVKWWRTEQYYSRPIKGSWAVEGGGALINQAIHQVDVLRYMVGDVDELFGYWQLGARHKIESEDVVCALLKYRCGATGVIQASTAFWPGYSERVEIHGTRGTAIFTGDKLTAWDVLDDAGEPAPVEKEVMSGSSDPMAIPVVPFERQFLDFGAACRDRRQPLLTGEEGVKALEIVLGVYESCRSGKPVKLGA